MVIVFSLSLNELLPRFITCQFLVMERVKAEQIFYSINRIENVQHADIPSDDLRLKTMLLIAGLTLIEEFSKIILFKNDFHYHSICDKGSYPF